MGLLGKISNLMDSSCSSIQYNTRDKASSSAELHGSSSTSTTCQSTDEDQIALHEGDQVALTRPKSEGEGGRMIYLPIEIPNGQNLEPQQAVQLAVKNLLNNAGAEFEMSEMDKLIRNEIQEQLQNFQLQAQVVEQSSMKFAVPSTSPSSTPASSVLPNALDSDDREKKAERRASTGETITFGSSHQKDAFLKTNLSREKNKHRRHSLTQNSRHYHQQQQQQPKEKPGTEASPISSKRERYCLLGSRMFARDTGVSKASTHSSSLSKSLHRSRVGLNSEQRHSLEETPSAPMNQSVSELPSTSHRKSLKPSSQKTWGEEALSLLEISGDFKAMNRTERKRWKENALLLLNEFKNPDEDHVKKEGDHASLNTSLRSSNKEDILLFKEQSENHAKPARGKKEEVKGDEESGDDSKRKERSKSPRMRSKSRHTRSKSRHQSSRRRSKSRSGDKAKAEDGGAIKKERSKSSRAHSKSRQRRQSTTTTKKDDSNKKEHRRSKSAGPRGRDHSHRRKEEQHDSKSNGHRGRSKRHKEDRRRHRPLKTVEVDPSTDGGCDMSVITTFTSTSKTQPSSGKKSGSSSKQDKSSKSNDVKRLTMSSNSGLDFYKQIKDQTSPVAGHKPRNKSQGDAAKLGKKEDWNILSEAFLDMPSLH